MIELIFVIVILGILAAVAIPKLAATRDDARISMIAQDTMSGALEIAAYAVSKGETTPALSDMSLSIKSLVDHGYATDTGASKAEIRSDTSTGTCLIVEVQNPGANTETLVVTSGPASDDNCVRLHHLIDYTNYPIPLRGNIISY